MFSDLIFSFFLFGPLIWGFALAVYYWNAPKTKDFRRGLNLENGLKALFICSISIATLCMAFFAFVGLILYLLSLLELYRSRRITKETKVWIFTMSILSPIIFWHFGHLIGF